MSMYEVPESHPRYLSLMTRENIVAGVEAGITSPHGLIAQGRGEAFDYLLGERTHAFAKHATRVAVAQIVEAELSVFSVNGNAAALAPKEIVEIVTLLDMKLEVNIFHASEEREQAILGHLEKHGAKEVLLPDPVVELPGMEHNRRFVNPEGIFKADVVFVPLEDGDRCEALVKAGKKVITVDLNPSSRTAMTAQITIVDNFVRVAREMIACTEQVKAMSALQRQEIITDFDNAVGLKDARAAVVKSFA